MNLKLSCTEAQANTESATAVGAYAMVKKGKNSTAVGHLSLASGGNQTAMGHQSIVAGNNDVAVGNNAAVGFLAVASNGTPIYRINNSNSYYYDDNGTYYNVLYDEATQRFTETTDINQNATFLVNPMWGGEQLLQSVSVVAGEFDDSTAVGTTF